MPPPGQPEIGGDARASAAETGDGAFQCRRPLCCAPRRLGHEAEYHADDGEGRDPTDDRGPHETCSQPRRAVEPAGARGCRIACQENAAPDVAPPCGAHGDDE